ncbi:hypothetical protein EUX98_g264 [Antrodiella citrinella]|uniref:Phosphatidic acid phosphatase type 2/haloperoxidase domain-containing protein n=1 Tax=Antrodiella citrinella TaxID=2447956 RepID=A0A4S4N4I0_9APHY|nr:hypothetical protein EUX98_g264 [Antrodiella citrinella]
MLWRSVVAYAPDCVGPIFPAWHAKPGTDLFLSALFGALNNIPGYKREFSLEDTSLRHPYAVHERVPDWALYVIAVASPAILQGCVNLLTVRAWWDLHNGLLGLLLGLSLTGSITQIVKLTVGRPRPDVIARCIPQAGAADPPFGLSSVAICTRAVGPILHDGWRSFPSGHASLSFAGLGFLSFYLAGKLHLFDNRGHAPKAWIAITPLAGATLVAISRTMDYRHHWQDVTAGAILGLVMSYFSYRQYYPSLAAPYSHHPYFPRTKSTQGLSLPLHQNPDNSSRERYDASTLNPRAGGYRDTLLGDRDDEVVDLEVPRGTVSKDERHEVPVWSDSEDIDLTRNT